MIEQLKKVKFAVIMTFKTYMKSDKDLFRKGNTPKDYLDLFIELMKK